MAHEGSRLLSSGVSRPLLAAPPALPPAPSSSSSSSSSSAPGVSIAILRSLTRSRAFSAASLPWLPPSRVPRARFPLTRLRHRLYLALSSPWTSVVGLAAFWLSTGAIVAFVAAFTVASTPDVRRRSVQSPPLYGTPERVFDAVDVAVVTVFAATYLARLLCATAVPDGGEERALAGMRAAAASASSSAVPGADRKLSAFVYVDLGDDDDDDDDDEAEERARTRDVGDMTPPVREFDDAPQPPPSSQAGSSAAFGGAGLGPATVFDLDSLGALRWVDATGAAGVAPGEPPPLFRWRCAPSYFRALLARNAGRVLWWGLNVYNVIELVCVVPFFVDLVSEDVLNERQAAPLRVARFLCLLRLLRLTSDSTGMRLLGRAVLSSTDTLRGSFFLACVSAVFFSMGIFLCEQGVYDETSGQWLRPDASGTNVVSPFSSMPVAAWFTIVTMTTVGYGDMAPTTLAGRALCVCCIVVGVLVLAVPATIIGFNLAVELEKFKARAEQRLRTKIEAYAAAKEAGATQSQSQPQPQQQQPSPSLRSITGVGADAAGAGDGDIAALRAEVREMKGLLVELLAQKKGGGAPR